LLLKPLNRVGFAVANRLLDLGRPTPQAMDFLEQRALEKELTADMEAFYAGVRVGRDRAIADHQRMGVEVTPEDLSKPR
jgi:hypothetical protein